MNERPPSDPADQAEEFRRRDADDVQIMVGRAIMSLLIPGEPRVRARNSVFLGDREGGAASHAGQITLDSGLINPELHANYYEADCEMKRRSRIADRARVIVAHELI
jgi:hypothetical protein